MWVVPLGLAQAERLADEDRVALDAVEVAQAGDARAVDLRDVAQRLAGDDHVVHFVDVRRLELEPLAGVDSVALDAG